MTLDFSVSLREYKDAVDTFCRYGSHQSYNAQVWSRLLNPALGAIMLISAVRHLYLENRYPFWALFISLIGLLLLFSPLMRRPALKRSYASQRVGDAARMVIDDSGITVNRADGNSSGFTRWPAIPKAITKNGNFILLTDSARMFILPQRVLSGESAAELTMLLQLHVAEFRQVT